ncbi:uncharacterized protein LAESUDRAFT_714692 [Laetiporus sulphureus 93-53]|uniref:Uncharacterized protein n=1 Tax=Laetiporus sulphureus 93-53 TaxID=1314785 RepID=A0A165DV13_9APHY|nr:uncharacterized protein LAESUDRAFT_714692 [Laetiporus sulphureus 93-53]KZT05682.1 hypothetical protein LAESUDRAFT_714692 [Laetiporus sulphureus 93-53]
MLCVGMWQVFSCWGLLNALLDEQCTDIISMHWHNKSAKTHFLIIGYEAHGIFIWNVETAEIVMSAQNMDAPIANVFSGCMSMASHKPLLAVPTQCGFQIYQVQSSESIALIKHELHNVSPCAFMFDDEVLVGSHEAGKVKLWRISDLTELQALEHDADHVAGIASWHAASGKTVYLAIASRGKVVIWVSENEIGLPSKYNLTDRHERAQADGGAARVLAAGTAVVDPVWAYGEPFKAIALSKFEHVAEMLRMIFSRCDMAPCMAEAVYYGDLSKRFLWYMTQVVAYSADTYSHHTLECRHAFGRWWFNFAHSDVHPHQSWHPAQDVEAVLSSLYNCGRDIDTMHVMKFARLAGIMEVGYQEGFDILYESTLRCSQQAFTSNLTQWQESMGLATYTNGLVLFEKTDAPHVLKIACKGYNEIVDEIPPVDCSEIVRAIWRLSQVNKMVTEIIFLCNSADDCLQKETCIEELLKMKGAFLEERDVIWSLHELMDYLPCGELPLCQNCTKRCHDHADMQLKDVWIQLPEVMHHHVDAFNHILEKLAEHIAIVLMGKHKPILDPSCIMKWKPNEIIQKAVACCPNKLRDQKLERLQIFEEDDMGVFTENILKWYSAVVGLSIQVCYVWPCLLLSGYTQFPFISISPWKICSLFMVKASIVLPTWLAMLIWAFVKGSDMSWAWLSTLNSTLSIYSQHSEFHEIHQERVSMSHIKQLAI